MDDLGFHGNVECCCGLIRNQHIGLHQQGCGYAGALAHAAGKLVGKPLHAQMGIRNTNAGQQVSGAGLFFSRRYPLKMLLEINQLISHGEHRIECCHGVLEHHGNFLPAQFSLRVLVQSQNVDAFIINSARIHTGIWCQKIDDGCSKGGFSTTAFTHNADHFSGASLQIGVAKGMDLANSGIVSY